MEPGLKPSKTSYFIDVFGYGLEIAVLDAPNELLVVALDIVVRHFVVRLAIDQLSTKLLLLKEGRKTRKETKIWSREGPLIQRERERERAREL